MLVLTRKVNEQILIGDNVKITIVRMGNQSIRIGIEAPDDVRVLRGELKQRDEQNTSSDARPAATDRAVAEPTSQAKPAAAPTVFFNRLRGIDRGRTGAGPLTRFVLS